MNTVSLLKGLQFIDSFFPSGGYAFSSGLEAAVQGGAVRNAEDLSRYVEDFLRGGMSAREAVAVGVAQQAAVKSALSLALDVDRELEAMKAVQESRLASRQMGRQVIRIASEQVKSPPILRDYRAAMESDRTPGHLPVSLGLTLGTFGWTRADAVAAYLYQTAAGLVSGALKLLPIGQREGQQLLERWLPLIDELSRAVETKTEMTSWAPVQEIYAMRHRRLTMRLFRS